jgi:hypothetical protein
LAGFHHFQDIFHLKKKRWGLGRCRTSITQGDDEKKEAPSSEWPCTAPSFRIRIELVSGCCLDSDTVVKK